MEDGSLKKHFIEKFIVSIKQLTTLADTGNIGFPHYIEPTVEAGSPSLFSALHLYTILEG